MDNQTNIQGLVGGLNQEETIQRRLFGADKVAQSNFALYSGGFVGINADNINQITDDVNGLVIDPIENILSGFGGTEETFNPGLKGQAATAAVDYVQSIKQLLAAYISTYKNFITLAGQSLESMQTNDQGNAEIIQSASQSIQQMASEIRVD